MKTAILILNWNGAPDTLKCLDSLERILTSEDYVFLIDNGSTDDSVERIELFFKQRKLQLVSCLEEDLVKNFKVEDRYYLIKGRKNLGFGGGNNIVLRKLKELNNEINAAWLLNNDTEVEMNTLVTLKKALLSNKEAGVAGSVILNLPSKENIQCTGVKYHKYLGVSELVNKNRPLKEIPSEKIRFDYLNGASLLFRVKSLEEVGFFDENFFLYSEEFDLQLRMQKKGYGLELVLDSHVYHSLGGGTRNKKYLFYYYYNKSAILLSKKHFSPLVKTTAAFNLAAITFLRAFPKMKNFMYGLKGIKEAL